MLPGKLQVPVSLDRRPRGGESGHHITLSKGPGPMKRGTRGLRIALAVGTAALLAACGGPPDPPRHFGVYLWDGGDLVRLQMRRLSDLVVRDDATGLTTPLSRQSRAAALGYPVTDDESPTLYVHFDNWSASSLHFQRYGLGQQMPLSVFPLIAPVEEHENLYTVEFPEESGRWQYEVLLPNDLICGFEVEPKI